MGFKDIYSRVTKNPRVLINLSIIFLVILIFIFLYLSFNAENTKNEVSSNTTNQVLEQSKLEQSNNETFEQMFSKLKDLDFEDGCKIEHLTCLNDDKEEQKAKVSNLPKLAIIIDDVAFANESKEIQAIIQSGKNITPSFFPNTNNHPDTDEFAKEFKHYMIHLPLEAIAFNSPEPFTLRVSDSYNVIENRIKTIKKDFPALKYVNNHTGSKFTSDENSMRKLFQALLKYDIKFIDSRTIASTKAPQLCKEYGLPYVFRSVFLDNVDSVEKIKAQLDLAVSKAKENKYIIAIGHPHANTLKAIKEYNFKDVELVFIDEIYNEFK